MNAFLMEKKFLALEPLQMILSNLSKLQWVSFLTELGKNRLRNLGNAGKFLVVSKIMKKRKKGSLPFLSSSIFPNQYDFFG